VAERQNADAESQFGNTHEDGRDRQFANAPAIGQWGWLDIVSGQRHAEQVPHHHHDDHQHRRQNRVSGHYEADTQQQHLHDFLGQGI
jgi:hypothetical protein